MLIKNKIYGEFEVGEEVLIELINSRALQRLKGVSQLGLPERFFHLKDFSRYTHSIGVFLLLRKLGAGIEEQIAGLLHDASHSVFSHIIDRIFGDPTKETYQDEKHYEILLRFDVKEILEKYNFNMERACDIESFGLLERDAPELCADRIDYTLQELSINNKTDLAKKLADALVAKDGVIVFNNLECAKEFAEIYLQYNREHWAGFEAVTRYHQTAEILKKAMSLGIINYDDLWTTDEEVIKKIYNSGREELITGFERMKNKETKIRFGIVAGKKFRHVDPHIFINNKICRLSLLDEEYKNKLEIERERSKSGVEI